VVPIVLGCRSLPQAFLPSPPAALWVSDFPTPGALARRVLALHHNASAYAECHEWRRGGAAVAPEFLRLWNGTVVDPYECRLCAAVRDYRGATARRPLHGSVVHPDFSCRETGAGASSLWAQRCRLNPSRPICRLRRYSLRVRPPKWLSALDQTDDPPLPHRAVNY